MSHLPTVSATFEGDPITAPAGASVAAALIASERVAWRTTRGGAQRGLFCGIGACFDCLVEIDGESGQRACMIPLREGMQVTRVAGEQQANSHE
jgi:predicted molibdopterin-dependent oxidoreductase YjgC